MRKKLLSILLVLSLMLALVPAAFATDAVRAELEIDGTTRRRGCAGPLRQPRVL